MMYCFSAPFSAEGIDGTGKCQLLVTVISFSLISGDLGSSKKG
jgi:hypothetical protein